MNLATVPTPSRDQRIQLLLLRCEIDRLSYRLLIRPKPKAPPLVIAGIPMGWLKEAASFSQLLPGRFGRWARRISLGHALFQSVRQASR